MNGRYEWLTKRFVEEILIEAYSGIFNMNKKSFYAILSAGLISSVLTSCGSLDNFIPPHPVGEGAQLEGPVSGDPGWQPYNNSAPTTLPVPSSPDPNWRSAASSGVVRSAPLQPVVRAEPIDPDLSATGSVRDRINDLRSSESNWGTYSGADVAPSVNRTYSSRPNRRLTEPSIYSPWADNVVDQSEKLAFERMVMEATRTGGSRLTLRDGKYLAADRIETTSPGCITVVVKASTNEMAPPFSTGEATVCDR